MKYGPVNSASSAYAKLRTLPLNKVSLTDGFWLDKQRVNRTVSLRHGYEQLEAHGNFHNLRLAAGLASEDTDGPYRPPVFMDSDVYKWLEALSYALSVETNSVLIEMANDAIALIEAAQDPDGYIDSYWQVVEPERRWQDLDHGHELYCAGHLMQAAVAHHRATGDARLLNVAVRFADNIDSVFGPDKQQGIPGHPEIETALVELYRETGERRYLDLAEFFLGQRGQGNLRGLNRNIGAEYHQDRATVRDTEIVEGHAVRQLYLTAGVADLYLETGEPVLWDAQMRQWSDFTQRKMHVTGGAGARYDGESFGDAYELPNDHCYNETCAQIASIQWNWRLLLATGHAKYADLMERTLYNGFLSGVSLDGRRYFYMNPLLSHGGYERPEWHSCACCPPNVMRLLASLPSYCATTDDSGVQIHHYAASQIQHTLPSGLSASIQVQTEYPWKGAIRVSVDESDSSEWTLSLRIPEWCEEWTATLNGGEDVGGVLQDGYLALTRVWQAGDFVELELEMEPFFVQSHPRIDPTRGCLAIQRGPLVYCIEEADQEDAVNLFNVRFSPSSQMTAEWQPNMLGGACTIDADGFVADETEWEGEAYRAYAPVAEALKPVRLRAIPYYAWANRGAGWMRVWIPVADRE